MANSRTPSPGDDDLESDEPLDEDTIYYLILTAKNLGFSLMEINNLTLNDLLIMLRIRSGSKEHEATQDDIDLLYR